MLLTPHKHLQTMGMSRYPGKVPALMEMPSRQGPGAGAKAHHCSLSGAVCMLQALCIWHPLHVCLLASYLIGTELKGGCAQAGGLQLGLWALHGGFCCVSMLVSLA